ncbi:MAG: RelA/SpoT family protein [Patescibacteria group bacterium]|jgi:GTP pyrophosphokinase
MDMLKYFHRIEQAIGTSYMPQVEEAVAFAQKLHRGTKRMTGEDFVEHPLRVSLTLADWHMDADTIIAGILHDAVEDSEDFDTANVKKHFGKNTAFLVEGVTKLGQLQYHGRERYAESLRKLFIAMSSDIRVILIKLADRLDNIKTVHVFDRPKRLRIARETLEIYAPIANRLGMGEIRGQLEDLAFPSAHEKDFLHLKSIIKEGYSEQERYVKKVIPAVKKALQDQGVKVLNIHGRAKRLYSLWKKLKDYHNDLSRIHDLVAIRIIVPDIPSCYATLGIIHSKWAPLKGRIKDYIAQPKPNGYRSLHTDIFCVDHKIVEVQIRDTQMHENAEYGIAAHWHYVESGKPTAGSSIKKRLEWINQLMRWQQSIADNDTYIKGLKIDIFKNRIFVFTPKGDVIDLPEQSTPIDFAYAIHTDVGNHASGVKVNEKMEKLSSTLQNGDMVEIIQQKKRNGPSRDWLASVKTHRAAEAIQSWVKKNR